MTISHLPPLPNITLTKLKLTLTALDPIYLPQFSGSAFRGGFGAALRRCCCITHKKTCQECMMKPSCVYSSIFETAHDHVNVSGYKLSDYPRPFIIEPPFIRHNHYQKGDTIECHLLLIGKAIDYLPYFIHAFSELGRQGIGSSRGRYRLSTITDTFDKVEKVIFSGYSEQIFSSPNIFSLHDLITHDIDSTELTITFKTPARIKTRNHLTGELDFHILIQNLVRRISLLSMACHDTSWSIDYKALIQQASEVVRRKDSNLYWYDWQRYSRRQKSRMNLGGCWARLCMKVNCLIFYLILR
jgi:hypothetical protein